MENIVVEEDFNEKPAPKNERKNISRKYTTS